jgi:hypothetical protein
MFFIRQLKQSQYKQIIERLDMDRLFNYFLSDYWKILNCIRLLTRLIPLLFEENEWRSYFWTAFPEEIAKEGEKKVPLASVLLNALSDLLFCPNFTVGPIDKNMVNFLKPFL